MPCEFLQMAEEEKHSNGFRHRIEWLIMTEVPLPESLKVAIP